MKKKKKKIVRRAWVRPKKIRRAKLKTHSSKLKTKPAYNVFLDPSLCKGCQICIEVCPKRVFEKTDKISKRSYQIIKAARPSECIGCLECEMLCPDIAITVEKNA